MNDIWALGITFYWLLTGRYPFGDQETVLELKQAILEQPIDFSLIINQQAREVIKGMLQKEVSKRAKLTDILHSSWVTQNGKENIKLDEINLSDI